MYNKFNLNNFQKKKIKLLQSSIFYVLFKFLFLNTPEVNHIQIYFILRFEVKLNT